MMDRAGPGLAPLAPAPSFSDLVLVLCLSHRARVDPANQGQCSVTIAVITKQTCSYIYKIISQNKQLVKQREKTAE